MAAEEQQVESEFNLDELHQSVEKSLNDEYTEAFELFKDDILKDYQSKIIESARDKIPNLFTKLFIWKTGYMNPDLSDYEKTYFKSYNNKKPFEIIHNYNKDKGDFYIKKELASIINDKNSSTKMFVGFKELTNKRETTIVDSQEKITKTWMFYCVVDKQKNYQKQNNYQKQQPQQHKNPNMKTSSNKKLFHKK